MAGKARIILDRRADVAIAAFDNPPDGLMDLDLLGELELLLDELEADRSVRVVIFRGSTRTAFIRHFDVRVIAGLTQGDAGAVIARMHAAYDRVQALAIPTIAAIDGACMGGGLEFALCCDLRIAALKAGPLGFPEASVGIFPATGGTQRTPRIVGEGRALELMLTARLLGAEEALRIGLVHRLADDALEAALRLAARLAKMPKEGLSTIKRLVRGTFDQGLGTGLKLEQSAFTTILEHPETRQALGNFSQSRGPVAR